MRARSEPDSVSRSTNARPARTGWSTATHGHEPMTSTALSVRIPESGQNSPAIVSFNATASVRVQTGSNETWESLFVSCLATIDSVVAALARRRRLSADDAADLGSMVRLRMLVDDYAILRKFQGRSSLRTYLTVVVHRIYLDERIARLGKWRPSQRARREGPTAVLFERLTMRDGLTFEDACTALEINHHLPVERIALESLYSKAHRSPRCRFISSDWRVEDIPSTLEPPDEGLDRAERSALARRARTALARAVASLTVQDRLILQLRFDRGLSVADVARMMGLNQKRLYARCGQLLKTLRSQLERDGLVAPQVLKLIGRTDVSVIPSERLVSTPQPRTS